MKEIDLKLYIYVQCCNAVRPIHTRIGTIEFIQTEEQLEQSDELNYMTVTNEEEMGFEKVFFKSY